MLYEQRKSLLQWPVQEDWVVVERRDPFSTSCKLFLALADDVGASIQGLSLMLDFAILSPCDGAAVLVFDEIRTLHLGRFDFGAAEIHSNSVARSGGVRGLEAMVRGSHVHPFGLNEPLGREQFLTSRGKPPAACVIDDNKPSFRQRMRLISREFRIDDLDEIPPPPYQGDLWR